MWRSWILAGFVVLALGVMTLVASHSSRPGSIPCIWGKQLSGEFNRDFSSRLDSDFGETVSLTMELKNISTGPRTIESGLIPIARVTVTTLHCEPVWQSPFGGQFLPAFDLDFEPGEVMRFGAEWSLIDDWGEMVPPGDYFAYVEIPATYPPGSDELTDHGVFKRIVVTEEHIRAARPAHPPAPVDPSACGVPVSEKHARVVMQKHRKSFDTDMILAANLLDENRQPTGAFGIREVAHYPPSFWGLPTEKRLPDCLDGVPTQLVLRPDE